MIPDFLWDLIPSKFKRQLATSALKSLVRKRDFDVHDWMGITSIDRTIDQLVGASWTPSQFIDVGAFEGEWTVKFLQFFPTAKYLLVEAQPTKCEILQERFRTRNQCQVVSTLLGEKIESKVKFNLAESGSSLLEDKSLSDAVSIVLPMTTLDHLTHEKNISHVDLLKLDVQGAESRVLRGGESTLKNTEFVLLEISFQELYDCAPLAISVINLMHDLGFRLYDICNMMRRPKDHALAQIDALFVRQTSPFACNPGWL